MAQEPPFLNEVACRRNKKLNKLGRLMNVRNVLSTHHILVVTALSAAYTDLLGLVLKTFGQTQKIWWTTSKQT